MEVVYSLPLTIRSSVKTDEERGCLLDSDPELFSHLSFESLVQGFLRLNVSTGQKSQTRVRLVVSPSLLDKNRVISCQHSTNTLSNTPRRGGIRSDSPISNIHFAGNPRIGYG